jgi:hypothetical protein
MLSGYAQTPGNTGLVLDDDAYNNIPQQSPTRALAALPASYSLKMYAPDPANQGDNQTCTAWASAYCAGTIIQAIRKHLKERAEINQLAYSAANAYFMAHHAVDCQTALKFTDVMDMMKGARGISLRDTGLKCITPAYKPNRSVVTELANAGYNRVFGTRDTGSTKILGVKTAIYNHQPVIIAVYEVNSLTLAYNVNLWQPHESTAGADAHAMCVVAYDDNKYGGAFELQNSWGKEFGKGGYIWIKYRDFAKYTCYACQLFDKARARSIDGGDSYAGNIKLLLDDGSDMPVTRQDSSADRPITTYKSVNSYKAGTDFQFKLSNDEPAYVYAISADLVSSAKRIFPGDGISPYLSYKQAEMIYPAEDSFIEFDKQPGTDYLCVFYSKTELDIDNIINQINHADGSFNQKVYKVTGSAMVNSGNLNFDNNNINFTGKSADKDYVIVMVELNHTL